MKKILLRSIVVAVLFAISMLPNSNIVYAAGGNPYGAHTPVETGLVNIEGLYLIGIVLFLIGLLLAVYGYFLKGKFNISDPRY